jgi:hypothetical protein
MDRTTRLSTPRWAILAIALGVTSASAAVAFAGPLSVRATAAITGTEVKGDLSVTNRGRTVVTLEEIAAVLEVQLPAGGSGTSLPPGSRRGYFRLAEIAVDASGPLQPRQTVVVPYATSLCGVESVAAAKSLRVAASARSGESVARGQSKKIAPPPAPVDCSECGNGVVEAGEACDGGDCCTSSCDLAVDGTSCADGDACTSSDVCSGGSCAGSTVSCDDGDPCSADSCDSTSGCEHETLPMCGSCDVAACTACQNGCPLETTCESACWASFMSCLSGCTSIYCAPFCQVDFGRCMDFCPPDPACSSTCESDNACAAGCTAP